GRKRDCPSIIIISISVVRSLSGRGLFHATSAHQTTRKCRRSALVPSSEVFEHEPDARPLLLVPNTPTAYGKLELIFEKHCRLEISWGVFGTAFS
ncbi:hypothetical protein, partial [Ensifer sp. 4252]|uniref:hypothetical protein n=1 Tax=Ensifer sp. 4252 TaxID=3373915 RepID=UPI003D2382AE